MAVMTDMEFEHGLPASLDAERTILGAILLDNAAYNEAASRLTPEDFAHGAHQKIYRRAGALIVGGHQADLVTLSEELARRKEIESVGGVAYISSLTEGLPRNLAIAEYVDIVKDKSVLRQVIHASSDSITRAADQSESAASVLDAVRSRIEVLSIDATRSRLERAGDYLGSEFPTPESLLVRAAKENGVPTGIELLDAKTRGLQREELIVIAARPSMGKTDFAIVVATNAAINRGLKVGFFSAEMSKRQIVLRALCSRARVSREAYRSGALGPEDAHYFRDAHADLRDSPLYIDDTGKMTTSHIRSECMRMKSRFGLDMAVIDYLQMLSTVDMSNRYNREREVAVMSASFKSLAKEIEAPVVLLAQLSREVTKRTDKRPVLSDLRESGAIEQDADLVGFLHRPSYYDPEDKTLAGKAEIIIAKQRNGPIGTVEAAYEPSTGRWSDPDSYYEQQAGFGPW